MASFADLVVGVRFDSSGIAAGKSQAEADLLTAIRAFQALGGEVERQLKPVLSGWETFSKNVIGVFAAYLSFQAFKGLIADSASATRELVNLSRITDQTPTSLNQMSRAAEAAGGSREGYLNFSRELGISIKRWERTVLPDPADPRTTLMAQWGVEWRGRKQEDIMRDMNRAYQEQKKLGGGDSGALLTLQTHGWGEAGWLLRKSSEEYDRFVSEFSKITDEQVKAQDDWNEAWAVTSDRLAEIGRQMLVSLDPLIKLFTKFMLDTTPLTERLAKAFEKIDVIVRAWLGIPGADSATPGSTTSAPKTPSGDVDQEAVRQKGDAIDQQFNRKAQEILTRPDPGAVDQAGVRRRGEAPDQAFNRKLQEILTRPDPGAVDQTKAAAEREKVLDDAREKAREEHLNKVEQRLNDNEKDKRDILAPASTPAPPGQIFYDPLTGLPQPQAPSAPPPPSPPPPPETFTDPMTGLPMRSPPGPQGSLPPPSLASLAGRPSGTLRAALNFPTAGSLPQTPGAFERVTASNKVMLSDDRTLHVSTLNVTTGADDPTDIAQEIWRALKKEQGGTARPTLPVGASGIAGGKAQLAGGYLHPGASGAEVREMQHKLGAPTSGDFDHSTMVRLAQFQRRVGLPGDAGTGDPNTLSALRVKNNPYDPGPAGTAG